MSEPSPNARQYPVGREDCFWSQVYITSGCWEWRGAGSSARDDGRYGICGYLGEPYGTHVLAYTLAYGPVPNGICVLHSCDNRWCVRPDHLFLGTKGDNYRDAKAKGRNSAGERHGMAKLDWSSVEAIRQSSESSVALAGRYGVKRYQIWSIRTGRSWRS